ncbi:hypothetical protein ACOSOMT5_P0695 [Acidiphilium sp. MT5]
MKDFDPINFVRGLDAVSRADLRAALMDQAQRAADRTARDAQIAEFCAIFFGERSQRGAAMAFIDEASRYRRTDWPRDQTRGGVDPRAGSRRVRLFAIMRLSGGEPNRIRTIQNILAKSGKF